MAVLLRPELLVRSGRPLGKRAIGGALTQAVVFASVFALLGEAFGGFDWPGDLATFGVWAGAYFVVWLLLEAWGRFFGRHAKPSS